MLPERHPAFERSEDPRPPLRRGRYATGYIGKWHLHSSGAAGPVPAGHRGGYDYWLASNVLEFTSDAYRTILYDNDDQPVDLPGYRVDALTDAVIRYVDGHRNEPFYLFTSYIEPHHQNHIDDYPPPDGYRERYTGRWTPPDLAALGGSAHQHLGGYYGMVKRLDEAPGRILDALKSLDLVDDTILLFTSDHGCHFKTRNREYKRSCHESSIRVPTAFHGPGFAGGGQIQELVSLVDLPPTLLDAAGLQFPGRCRAARYFRSCAGTPPAGRRRCSCRSAKRRWGGRSVRDAGSTVWMPRAGAAATIPDPTTMSSSTSTTSKRIRMSCRTSPGCVPMKGWRRSCGNG